MRVTSTQEQSFYDAVGGHETFVRITKAFYEGVAADPELRALYPEEDLGPAEERFRMFLEQYWGGPTTYSDTRGHPRLGQRHAPFAVTPQARDRWLKHMHACARASPGCRRSTPSSSGSTSYGQRTSWSTPPTRTTRPTTTPNLLALP